MTPETWHLILGVLTGSQHSICSWTVDQLVMNTVCVILTNARTVKAYSG